MILREALKSLAREEREFTKSADANKAKSWLNLIVAMQADPKQQLDDLVDLALAAGKDNDPRTLDNASEKISNLLGGKAFSAADNEKAYYWLARSYRSCGDESAQKKVFFYCDKAFESGDAKSRRAAKEAAEFALALGKIAAEKGSAQKGEAVAQLDTAIEMSHKAKHYAAKLKSPAFDDAANLNGRAFALLVDATRAKFPGDKPNEVGKIFVAELPVPEKMEAFHLQVVVHKLKYLRKFSYFDEQKVFLTKPGSNEYFVKTMVEADRARQFKKPDDSDGKSWTRMQTDLVREMFECQFGFGYRAFIHLHETAPGSFSETHRPMLKATLENFHKARDMNAPLDDQKGALLDFTIGATYVCLARSHGHQTKDDLVVQYKTDDDRAKAVSFLEKAVKELANVQMNKLPDDFRDPFSTIKGRAEAELKRLEKK